MTMTHNQIETRSTSYLSWSRAVAIALALALLVMWLLGYGPFRANCCGVSEPAIAPASAAVIAPTAVSSAPAVSAVTKPDVCAAATLRAEIGFDTGSISLSAKGRAALDAVVSDCLFSKGASVTGHTDNVGDPVSNQTLSQLRANAVVAYLRTRGVSSDKLIAKGMGDKEPVADNSTASGRTANRRMEIKLNP
jgi:outer membrane protein OmpA-like peptidoglycan-associated protein